MKTIRISKDQTVQVESFPIYRKKAAESYFKIVSETDCVLISNYDGMQSIERGDYGGLSFKDEECKNITKKEFETKLKEISKLLMKLAKK